MFHACPFGVQPRCRCPIAYHLAYIPGSILGCPVVGHTLAPKYRLHALHEDVCQSSGEFDAESFQECLSCIATPPYSVLASMQGSQVAGKLTPVNPSACCDKNAEREPWVINQLTVTPRKKITSDGNTPLTTVIPPLADRRCEDRPITYPNYVHLQCVFENQTPQTTARLSELISLHNYFRTGTLHTHTNSARGTTTPRAACGCAGAASSARRGRGRAPRARAGARPRRPSRATLARRCSPPAPQVREARSDMALRWQSDDNHMAITWQSHGNHMAQKCTQFALSWRLSV